MCGTWPLSAKLWNWIFEGIIFGPFHTFDEPIVYIPTKFRETILIDGRCPPNETRIGSSGVGILLAVPILTSAIFRGFPVYYPIKFQECRSTRGWAICDSTFSISLPTFKPTLPAAQRHSAVMQAIYRIDSIRSWLAWFFLYTMPQLLLTC